jgi:hypothetical protein
MQAALGAPPQLPIWPGAQSRAGKGFALSSGPGQKPGGMMERSIRVMPQGEKPGRLQLAILEWQRQLVAKREAPTKPVLREDRVAA